MYLSVKKQEMSSQIKLALIQMF